MLDRHFWRGRRVLVTGHTGFKGAWLTVLLRALGAEIFGLALAPETVPNLFELAGTADGIDHRIGDVRDLPTVERALADHQPEFVFHLAAQSLVRRSYRDPIATYTTNVIGTVNLLDAMRRCQSARAVVVVTSDKCYATGDAAWPYREPDRLGGSDPYSNSKACAELVTECYRRSYFPPERYREHCVAAASARAGNVIGGGDWAADRLVPDAIRAFAAGRPLAIRNPAAVRPWQLVLDPLIGYLLLAERLTADGPGFSEAWNFGPDREAEIPVSEMAARLCAAWGGDASWRANGGDEPFEAHALRLDASKARTLLGWHSLTPLDEALEMTIEWYRSWAAGGDVRRLTRRQAEAALDAACGADA